MIAFSFLFVLMSVCFLVMLLSVREMANNWGYSFSDFFQAFIVFLITSFGIGMCLYQIGLSNEC